MGFMLWQMKKWEWQKCGHLSGFNVSFLSYGPQIVKNFALWHFLADVSKKSRAAIAFNVYTSKSSRFAFNFKMALVIMLWIIFYKISTFEDDEFR